MGNKEEEVASIKFKVTGAKKDMILDYKGIVVPGFIFHYISERGSTGFIEITEKDYTKDKAKKLIEEDLDKLEALL